MSMKKAAEELLKIADDIDKDAAEVTQLVCDKCNHTATLADINSKRLEAAKQASQTEKKDVTVASVGVNDKICCPACDGVMAYRATEASTPYYFDEKAAKKDPDAPHSEKTETPAEEAAESVDTQKKEREQGAHTAAVDYDSLQRYL